MRDKEQDDLLAFLFIKRLLVPITKTPAYKLGLINSTGVVVREPVTKQEKETLTLLDRLCLKLKGLLGTRLINLYSFLYVNTTNLPLKNNLIVMNSPSMRTEMRRMEKTFRNSVN